ncbi:MAG: DUF2786 domain-containing protein [Magnetococcales bacterium]|nr:DUF2786 domain-containing protein [Magnetococcales bacterium]
MAASSRIVNRVRKLRALAADPRGNDHERRVAAEKAASLMRSHGLTPGDLGRPLLTLVPPPQSRRATTPAPNPPEPRRPPSDAELRRQRDAAATAQEDEYGQLWRFHHPDLADPSPFDKPTPETRRVFKETLARLKQE